MLLQKFGNIFKLILTILFNKIFTITEDLIYLVKHFGRLLKTLLLNL